MSAIRQLKVRYRGTFLGVLWSFANPILMTVLYARSLFGTAFSKYYGGSVVRYVFSAFVAVVVVTFFCAVYCGRAGFRRIERRPSEQDRRRPRDVSDRLDCVANAFQQSITTFPLIVLLDGGNHPRSGARRSLRQSFWLAVVALVTGFGLGSCRAFRLFSATSRIFGPSSALSFG
jgi:hypothetical protein